MTSIWKRLKQGLDDVVDVAGRWLPLGEKDGAEVPQEVAKSEWQRDSSSRYYFDDFNQASNYAKAQVLKRRETVKIERDCRGWFVLGDVEPSQPPKMAPKHPEEAVDEVALSTTGNEQPKWLPYDEWARLRDGKRRVADVTNFRINERHWEEREKREHRQLVEETHRQLRMSERSEFYRQLSRERLAELWKSRESLDDFDCVEEEAVRLALREKLGITPTEISLSVYPRCLMVGKSCACRN